METPLRAIEMSDSSTLGINPSLAAGVHDVCMSVCVLVHTCISASPFVCVCICVHLGKKFLYRGCFFLLRVFDLSQECILGAL